MGSLGPFEILILLIVGVVPAILFWRIFSKAGFPGVAGLLMLIPGLNIVVIAVFAFIEWPIERELREAQRLV